jgi:benzoate-CoA ligase
VIPAAGEAFNAGGELSARAAARGDEPVYRCEGRSVSGRALVELVLASQRALAREGLSSGDRVLLVLRDTPAFVAAFLGALRAGVIPVPVSTLLPPKDVAFIAQDSGARTALVDAALASEVPPSAFPAGVARIVVGREGFEGLGDPGGDAPPAAPTQADDAAFLLYTSGTSGAPKGVVHRHADLRATAECYARAVLGVGPGDRLLSAAKLFFAYGLGNGLTFPLWLGAEAVLHPGRPSPEEIFGLVEREQPTIFFGVPTLYATLLAHPSLPHSLGRIRLCVSAGEALPPVLLERWRDRFGVEVLDGLGSTEMLHIFVSSRPGSARPGSSGTPVPGYSVRVVDEAGRDVAEGDVGTLLAAGPSAATAYWNRRDETAATMFAPGWLRTGDSVRRDADGFLYHEGRTDDLLKVSGIFVSPFEVEATLLEHEAVAEVAVVARTDELGLVKPCAFVVPKAGAEPGSALARALQTLVKQRLAPHKYPRWIAFRDALPKTATGKIRRHDLRAWAAALREEAS